MTTNTVSKQAAEHSSEIIGTLPPSICFDEYGFLIDPAAWTEEMAVIIAHQDGIGPLDEGHWQVIRFIRDRYLRLGAIPPVRSVCRSSTLSREELKKMFGSCYEIWRIAGLPDPGAEARNYMD